MSEEESEEECVDLNPLLDQVIKALEDCDTNFIDELIAKSLVTPFADADYLEAGSFGSKPFLLRPEIAKKLKKESIPVQDRYSLSDYSTLLTSYWIRMNCIDSSGIITPTPFLCKLFNISTEPCTIVKFLGMATKILL